MIGVEILCLCEYYVVCFVVVDGGCCGLVGDG